LTTRSLLLVMVRRWYVVLLGLTATVAGCWLVAAAAPSVCWSRTIVTVLQPHSNPLHDEGSSSVGLASLLVIRANGGPATTKTSSPETTLYGEGILDGSRIRQRDLGRQWTTSIPDPVIYVEAVSPSAEVTTSEINRMITALDNDLTLIQDNLKVPRGNRAFLQLSPEMPTAARVTGDQTRAVGASGLLGLILTALALYVVDRRWPVVEPAPA